MPKEFPQRVPAHGEAGSDLGWLGRGEHEGGPQRRRQPDERRGPTEQPGVIEGERHSQRPPGEGFLAHQQLLQYRTRAGEERPQPEGESHGSPAQGARGAPPHDFPHQGRQCAIADAKHGTKQQHEHQHHIARSPEAQPQADRRRDEPHQREGPDEQRFDQPGLREQPSHQDGGRHAPLVNRAGQIRQPGVESQVTHQVGMRHPHVGHGGGEVEQKPVQAVAERVPPLLAKRQGAVVERCGGGRVGRTAHRGVPLPSGGVESPAAKPLTSRVRGSGPFRSGTAGGPPSRGSSSN